MKEIRINKNDSGQRIDKFLSKALTGLPLSLIYKYIRLKRVKLNGKRCHNNDKLNEGDILSLYINDEFFETEKNTDSRKNELLKITDEPEIVYEDENIIILYKPVGIDVHSGSERKNHTILDIIHAYLYKKGEYDPNAENSFSPAVCNRLDRNTTGLVIAAKNAAALREVNENIRERRIHKKYLCICSGKFHDRYKTETAYHKKGRHNLVNIRKDEAEGYKKIITEYRVLDEKNGLYLVEVNLITGRTHQIRAHLAYLGTPVLGDGKYGNVSMNKRLGVFHQQLCAYSLEFETGENSVLGYLKDRVFVSPKTGFQTGFFKIP